MSWSYSGNPGGSGLDLVRFRLGDTDPSAPLASDEECLQALSDERGDSWLAAATIAESKALSFLWRATRERRGGRGVAGREIEYTQQAEVFKTLAATLRSQASIRTTGVYAGGIDQAEKDAARQDTTTVRPAFTTDRRPWAESWDEARGDL